MKTYILAPTTGLFLEYVRKSGLAPIDFVNVTDPMQANGHTEPLIVIEDPERQHPRKDEIIAAWKQRRNRVTSISKPSPAMAAGCLHDTNGDGNCGRQLCEVCHPENFPLCCVRDCNKRERYRTARPSGRGGNVGYCEDHFNGRHDLVEYMSGEIVAFPR